MTGVLVLVAIVFVLAGVAAFLQCRRGADSGGGNPLSQDRLAFMRRRYLLSKAEHSLCGVLQQVPAARVFQVFVKVRLCGLIEPERGTDGRQGLRNQIGQKHVDFVLCEPDTLSPVLVIEDDSSHERPDRRARDLFVDPALAAAGLPVLRVKSARGYSTAELDRQIAERAPALPAKAAV